MFGLGFPELILILVIALIIFGPGKLPEVGKAIGKSVREFKKATNDIKQEFETDESPQTETKKATVTDATSKTQNIPEPPKNPYATVLDKSEQSESGVNKLKED